jgi:hypothetical protein
MFVGCVDDGGIDISDGLIIVPIGIPLYEFVL